MSLLSEFGDASDASESVIYVRLLSLVRLLGH